MSPSNSPLPARIADKIVESDAGCWEWAAARSNGYGRAWLGGKDQYAHRLVYALLVGPVPQRLQLDHLCRNRSCVNPAHLEPVTAAENIRRGEAGIHKRAKTRCPAGHQYDAANTIRTARGHRKCRTCARLWDRERYQRSLARAE